jgi:cytochrome P450
MVDRYATRDVSLGGAAIRPGDQVTVSITGANRDPAVFADPDAYLPSRANAAKHLTFAHGPHFCVGAHLARLEAETALAAVQSLPGLRLAAPVEIRGVVFRKPVELRVAWDA